MLKDYQQQFIELSIRYGALRFGEFTLKSGRISPYFFNAGHFTTGYSLTQLGECYAKAFLDHGFDQQIELLFGPAYKGIPLATALAHTLYREHAIDLPCAFNRKERKDHGEGGHFMGAEIQGNILIVDDTITAGTAVREILHLLPSSGCSVKGLLIGLNRQELGQHDTLATDELQNTYNIPVASIINVQHICHYLNTIHESDQCERMQQYMSRYCRF